MVTLVTRQKDEARGPSFESRVLSAVMPDPGYSVCDTLPGLFRLRYPTRAIPSVMPLPGLVGHEIPHELGGFGWSLTHLHAHLLQGFLLRLGGTD